MLSRLIQLRILQVDIATWGHVHQYERTCAVQNCKCVYKPTKNIDGIDTYSSSTYAGPIHVIIGMAGFRLDQFVDIVRSNHLLFRTFDSLIHFVKMSLNFISSKRKYSSIYSDLLLAVIILCV